MAEVRLLSQGDIATYFEVRPATVRDWERAGCPVERKAEKAGQASLYRLADVHAWLLQRERERESTSSTGPALDLNEARRRKTAAEATLAEISLAKVRGRYVELEVMAEVMADAAAAVTARLQQIGAKLAPMLELADGATARQEMIDAAVNEALHELSDPTFGLFRDPEGEGEEGDPLGDPGPDAPGGAADRQRVGRR